MIDRIAIVAVVALASTALAIHFSRDLRGSIQVTSQPTTGRPRLRDGSAAVVLIVLMSLSIYATFALRDANRIWLVSLGVLAILLCLVAVVPQVPARRFLLPALKGYLFFLGVMVMLGGLWRFWVAAVEGRAVLPDRGLDRVWIYADRDPVMFWISVIANGVVLTVVGAFALSSLRHRGADTPNRTMDTAGHRER